MAPVALGTQTGGSTLRPAAYNGIVGLKPTYGLISCYGVLPVAWSFDTVGILARSVEDAAYVLDSIAQYDPLDPASRKEREPSYLLSDKSHLDSPPRIGLIRSFFLETSTPEVRAHTEAVAQAFESAGASVREVSLPESFGEVSACFRGIFNGEVAAAHEQRYAERGALYGPKIAALIEQGLEESAVTYIDAVRARPGLADSLEALTHEVDVLLMPTTPAPAPADRSNTGDASLLSPWTFVGVPTMSLPSGIAADGLPMGVQLVGQRGQDLALLKTAQWCAQVLDFSSHPSSWER
jgi:amidase